MQRLDLQLLKMYNILHVEYLEINIFAIQGGFDSAVDLNKKMIFYLFWPFIKAHLEVCLIWHRDMTAKSAKQPNVIVYSTPLWIFTTIIQMLQYTTFAFSGTLRLVCEQLFITDMFKFQHLKTNQMCNSTKMRNI